MAKTVSTGFLNATVNGIKINTSIIAHTSNFNNVASRIVGYVVMHYTGNKKDAAKSNATYFKSANRSASAHFFVDDSEIYQSVELRDTAWHCGAKSYKHKSCRNANAIGIEMCCTAGNYKISDTTKKNAAYLCAYICNMIGISASEVDTYVLRHYDVTGKSCPAQMATDNNAEWKAFKTQVKEILKSGSLSSSSSGSSSKTSTAKTPDGVEYTSCTPYTVKVNVNDSKVRKGPGTSYAVVTSVNKGQVYTIIGTKKNGSTTWGYLKSKVGWISLSLVTKC